MLPYKLNPGYIETFTRKFEAKTSMASPWFGEPVGPIEETSKEGYPIAFIRNPQGAWCGYVGLRPEEPAYELEAMSTTFLRVHGGVDLETISPDSKMLWLGFSCSHSQDLSPLVESVFDEPVYRTLAFARKELEGLCAQLAAYVPKTSEELFAKLADENPSLAERYKAALERERAAAVVTVSALPVAQSDHDWMPQVAEITLAVELPSKADILNALRENLPNALRDEIRAEFFATYVKDGFTALIQSHTEELFKKWLTGTAPDGQTQEDFILARFQQFMTEQVSGPRSRRDYLIKMLLEAYPDLAKKLAASAAEPVVYVINKGEPPTKITD